MSVLRALWTEIGTTEDKRAATLEQLRASFAALCDDAISRHQGVRDELAQRVDSYQRAIDRIQRELHSERDALPHHDDSPLLQRSEKLMLQLSMLQKVPKSERGRRVCTPLTQCTCAPGACRARRHHHRSARAVAPAVARARRRHDAAAVHASAATPDPSVLVRRLRHEHRLGASRYGRPLERSSGALRAPDCRGSRSQGSLLPRSRDR